MTTWGLRWAASSAWQVLRRGPGNTGQGGLSGSAYDSSPAGLGGWCGRRLLWGCLWEGSEPRGVQESKEGSRTQAEPAAGAAVLLALRTPGVERAARLCDVQSQPRSTGHPPAPSRPFTSRCVHHNSDSGVNQKRFLDGPQVLRLNAGCL